MEGKGYAVLFAVCGLVMVAWLFPSCVRRTVVLTQVPRVESSLCEILDNWRSYHQKPTRIQAIFVTGYEGAVLFDPSCRNRTVWVEFPTTAEPPAQGDRKRLNRLLENGTGAAVVFEGVFYGPALNTDVDPRIPTPIREVLEKSPKQYGHLGAFAYMLHLNGILSVDPVPRGTKLY